jgi:uncharacterized protein YdcH (DUF465 family)
MQVMVPPRGYEKMSRRAEGVKMDKHDLIHELPEYREAIHRLKINDAHFARLFERYHDVDREVRRIETGIEVSSDGYIEGLKRERLWLKDQLYGLLQAQAKTAE